MKIKYTIEQAEQLVVDHGAEVAESILSKSEVVDAAGKVVEFKIKKQAQAAPEFDTAAISKAVAEEVKKTLAEERKQNPPIREGVESKAFTIPAEAKRWGGNLKAFKDDETAYGFGQWAIWSLRQQTNKPANAKSCEWLAERGIITKASNGQYIAKAQSEGVNSAGGDLVPEQYIPELIRLVETYGVFRANARVRPMTSDVAMMPRRTGGLTAYFGAESKDDSSTALTKSSITTAKVQLVAQKLYTYTLESVELVEDAAVSIGDLLAQEIALAFAQKEDNCGFLGTGTSTYGGITGVIPFAGSASVYDAISGNTAFSTLDLADFHGMTGKLPDYARPNAKWYISRAGFSDSMERLAYAGGGNTVDSISGGKGLMFLGYPVVISQVMNSTLTAQASTRLFAFGDLSMGAVFGDRRSMTIQTDMSRHFDTDQVAVKGTERFDIGCHTFDSTSAAGPIIVLKTPAS